MDVAICRCEVPLEHLAVHPSRRILTVTMRLERLRISYPVLPGWSNVGERIEVEPLWKRARKRLGPVNLQSQSLGIEKIHVAAPPGDQCGQRSSHAHWLGKARVAMTN